MSGGVQRSIPSPQRFCTRQVLGLMTGAVGLQHSTDIARHCCDFTLNPLNVLERVIEDGINSSSRHCVEFVRRYAGSGGQLVDLGMI